MTVFDNTVNNYYSSTSIKTRASDVSGIKDQNKEIIRTVCQHLNDRNALGAAEYIAEDGYWTINGDPNTFSFAGRYDKSAMTQLLTGFLGSFSEFEFNIISMTTEEDRVVVEAHSKGIGNTSRGYENRYLMLYQLKNGKIIEAKEFFDPFSVLTYTRDH